MEIAQAKIVNRAATMQPAALVNLIQSRAASSVHVQTFPSQVSSPRDPAEKEADTTAKRIMRMAVPESSVAYVRTEGGGVFRQISDVQISGDKKEDQKELGRPPRFQSPYITRFLDSGVFARQKKNDEERIQRKAEGPSSLAPNISADIQSSTPSGTPLPLSVRRFMEPRFRADFSRVNIHTGEKAARLSKQLNAQAFAVGNHVFFGRDKFKPESQEGKELIAHELTHTLQQGAAVQGEGRAVASRWADDSVVVQRSEDPQVSAGHPAMIQRFLGLDIPNPLDWIAGKANIIPGFRMFTIVLGVNPINMSSVDRSAANILRALIEFMPGGGLITQALENSGVFEKAGAFVEQQVKALGMTGSAIKAAVDAFISSLSLPADLLSPGKTWARAERIFTAPITQLKNFAVGVVTGIVDLVKDAILRPIAKLAEGTEGYALLKAVMGKDPITGDRVPQTAETIIGPFMKLIGQGEIWENMQKANAIPRAFAWFKGALAELLGFVNEIPGLFIAAFKSLTVADIILVPLAFVKLAKVFGSFLGRFSSWAGNKIWNLLEIIFDVVSPGAFGYVKKTGAALKSILKNPLPFVGNLVKAAKLGFQNFAGNFLTHLKKGLIDWLIGALPGVYIPKAITLPEVGKFALSVLGITWAQIRGKIVKALGPNGEKIMAGLEVVFDVVVALVKGGPAAAWEVIKDKLTGLKDQVISGITAFIVETVVTKAIPKLIAMFIPGAGFLSAIISIYDTIMVFVQKISKIIQVVTGFINSIVAIAAGNIGAAASKVENVLGGLLSLAISFLAGFAGLGKVADKVMGVIQKVRAVVDKALDTAINFIVTKAKALFAKLFGKGGKDEKDKKDGAAVKAKVGSDLASKKVNNSDEEKTLLASIFSRYRSEGLKGIRFQPSKKKLGAIDVIVSASLAEKVAQLDMGKPEGLEELAQIAGRMSVFAGRTTIHVFYDTDRKRFGRPITQKAGQAGHAELYLRKEFPALLQRIRRERNRIVTPPNSPVPIHLDINRTPCDGCATSHIQEIVNAAKSAYGDVPFTLTISSASVSQGAQITTETGIIALIDQGVELTSSTVWNEVKKQMLSNGIKQLEHGGKTFDIDDVNEFIDHADDVQRLIDKAVAKLKKSKPATVVQGSGVS